MAAKGSTVIAAGRVGRPGACALGRTDPTMCDGDLNRSLRFFEAALSLHLRARLLGKPISSSAERLFGCLAGLQSAGWCHLPLEMRCLKPASPVLLLQVTSGRCDVDTQLAATALKKPIGGSGLLVRRTDVTRTGLGWRRPAKGRQIIRSVSAQTYPYGLAAQE